MNLRQIAWDAIDESRNANGKLVTITSDSNSLRDILEQEADSVDGDTYEGTDVDSCKWAVRVAR